MLAAFQRMSESLLTILGQEAFLRDGEPCRVNIEHGVQTIGEDETTVITRSVATVSQTMNPKVGDRLVHPDGIYRLDAIHAKSGVNQRFIILPLEA